MKKQQIWSLAFLAILVVTLIVQIVAVSALIRLQMVPGLLILLLAVVFLAYDGAMFFFMFLRGKKPGSRKQARMIVQRRRIISCVMAVVMFCSCIAVSTVATDVRKTFEAAQAASQIDSEKEEPAITRTIFVRTYDSAEKLEDAKAYSFGIVKNYDDVCTQQAVDAIEAQVGGKIETIGYLNIFEMADALLSGKLDAMILKSGYISVLEADSRYETFGEQTRALVDVEIEGNGEEMDGNGLLLNAEAEIAQDGKLKPFITYISGSDSRSGTLENARSDVNILAVVNPETRQVLLLNTPRDYYVPMPLVEDSYDKLTHCGIYGISCSMGSLAKLYDCDVQYYVRINFDGFKKVIDAMGGITVESDYAFVAITRTNIKEGTNHLNGQQALDFARERYTLQGGDHDRGKNQMKVIKAVVEKATSGTTILTNYSQIMKSVDGMFEMNIPSSLIGEVVKRQVADMSGWNIMSYSVRGSSGNYECYSVPGELLYAIAPDESYVNKAQDLIDKVLNGEILTAEMLAS